MALALCAGIGIFWTPISQTLAQVDLPFIERNPDIPEMLRNAKATTTKEEFLEDRANGHALLRGIDKEAELPDPQLRARAVEELNRQEAELRSRPASEFTQSLLAPWTAIGPTPILSGTFRYSGRVTAIAVHPTNPDIVYAGVAQGGIYRSTNGGVSWTPIFDSADSLAIGALTLAPSNPELLYVGTGEANFSSDSFFGVGVYRIENASTSATLNGPFNKTSGNADIFTGRGISEIVVHPTDPDTIFVSTTSGVGGIGGSSGTPLPSRGLYRSTNAAGASPTFAKLGLVGGGDASVRDIAIDPADPNILVAGVVASGPTGGIYRSVNALSASPTFTQSVIYTGTSTSDLTTEFAAMRPPGAGSAVFYAASGQSTGTVLRSVDGGATWTQRIDNNFCNPQCFYNIAVAVDPINPEQVYVGGAPSVVAAFSTNGGGSFTEGGSGVHVDTHVLTVSPSSPNIVYLGTDGGVYKSTNSGASFQHLNTAEFSATQFMGISVHPTNANFTVGGTQDNGTNFFDATGGSWVRIDGGDGGYSIIDSNATDLTNVRVYHTYFSRISSIVGYATRATTTGAWTFRGCGNGVTPNNGINCNDTSVLFYAPLESGPGNPNTVYYGTDRLYRSADTGATHTVASQAPIQSGVAISAIGISPQNDNIRLVGLRNGGLWGTNTGSSTLTDLDPGNTVPNGFVSRVTIDPLDAGTAYVTLASFGVNNVYKTENLDSGVPVWTNISGTLPRVPISAFLVDPAATNMLYAGTDIGLFVSSDTGATWQPFGSGYPRVAIFDIAKTAPGLIRIATHGRGMWQIPALSPTSVPGLVSGRVSTPTGLGLRNAQVTLTDPAGVKRVATTSSFGLYSFPDVPLNQTYFISVNSKRYRFTTQTVLVSQALTTVDFTGQE